MTAADRVPPFVWLDLLPGQRPGQSGGMIQSEGDKCVADPTRDAVTTRRGRGGSPP
ncbi:MAG TPA: hypothetical protein VM533_21080 [Fimbriiglobus sp.]|nr:hypothetical protein [Fimbriiglobus sp.]